MSTNDTDQARRDQAARITAGMRRAIEAIAFGSGAPNIKALTTLAKLRAAAQELDPSVADDLEVGIPLRTYVQLAARHGAHRGGRAVRIETAAGRINVTAEIPPVTDADFESPVEPATQAKPRRARRKKQDSEAPAAA